MTTGNVGINISKHRFYASEVPFTLPRDARLTILAANIVNLGGQNSLSYKPKKVNIEAQKALFWAIILRFSQGKKQSLKVQYEITRCAAIYYANLKIQGLEGAARGGDSFHAILRR